MKRQIKFRGKRIDNGEWVYGILIVSTLRHGQKYEIRVLSTDIEGEGDKDYPVHFFTLGQYAFEKDREGNELYEGDILQTKNLTNNEFDLWTASEWGFTAIVFDEKNKCFSYTSWHMAEDSENSVYAKMHCERIGNIHDNPNIDIYE